MSTVFRSGCWVLFLHFMAMSIHFVAISTRDLSANFFFLGDKFDILSECGCKSYTLYVNFEPLLHYN